MLVSVFGLACVSLIAIAFLGGHTGDDFAKRPVERNGASRSLVVLLHALGAPPGSFAAVIEEAHKDFPDADLFAPEYVANTFSNTNPFELASKLDRRLQEIYLDSKNRGAPYRSIVLVGHSAGALILRRAYLYGMGYRSANSYREVRQLEPRGAGTASTWVTVVDRMVLLAAMNRGWDLQKIDNRTWTAQLMMTAGVVVAGLTGTGKLVMGLERGSPFIGNLRLDWLRMVRKEGDRAAPVVQLLGEKDDLVTPGDDIDNLTAPNFIFIRVDDTDHNNIRKMSRDDPTGAKRADILKAALTLPLEQLRASYTTNHYRLEKDEQKKHIVFIKHGIRDMADWSFPLSDELQRVSPDIAVVVEKFPYFSMISFLAWWDRQSEVRRFVDEYASVLAKYPNADKISYVGHSFGTYIVASALERYPSITFHRIYFAGSTVRRNYDWGALKDRFHALRNDRASSDWVVAIFPRAFEQLSQLLGAHGPGPLDEGSAGFNGFTQARASDFDFHYLPGGHGAAFDFKHEPDQLSSIAQFIVNDDPRQASGPHGLVPDPAWWSTLLGQLALVVCITLILVATLGGWLLDRRLRAHGMSGRGRLGSGIAYMGLVLIILNTF